jgi:outer membrane protein assembly factor BamB
LDAHSGTQVWACERDFSKGDIVFYLDYADETLVVLGSSSGQYHLYTYDARRGSPLWERHFNWIRDNHGGAIQHPTIAGGIVYVEPCAFKLRTGEAVASRMVTPRKCGTVSASAMCLFYRNFYPAMWDLRADKRYEWAGIRPGCWLHLIPAGGVLLAPESSSGCACSFPLQTSIAFVPERQAPAGQEP